MLLLTLVVRHVKTLRSVQADFVKEYTYASQNLCCREQL